MNIDQRLNIGFRLAYALLRQYGTLSLADIEALPVVQSREEALSIANRLLSETGGNVQESEHARVGTLTRQDDLLRLRSTARRRRSLSSSR